MYICVCNSSGYYAYVSYFFSDFMYTNIRTEEKLKI